MFAWFRFVLVSFEDASMQIFVKTLTCGPITLDVKSSDTISMIRRKIRCKIDDMFLGIRDVEILEIVEGNHGLVFAGHLLQDERTLSDYKITSDDTIRMTSTLDGGGTYVSFIHFRFGNANNKCNKCLVIAAASLCFFLLFCICLIHTT